MDATDLNKRLKDLMDGLSVKVFRTYNASVTLDALLHKDSTTETVDEKKAEYDRANKEARSPRFARSATLCLPECMQSMPHMAGGCPCASAAEAS